MNMLQKLSGYADALTGFFWLCFSSLVTSVTNVGSAADKERRCWSCLFWSGQRKTKFYCTLPSSLCQLCHRNLICTFIQIIVSHIEYALSCFFLHFIRSRSDHVSNLLTDGLTHEFVEWLEPCLFEYYLTYANALNVQNMQQANKQNQAYPT